MEASMADRLIEGYARALFEAARAEGQLENVEDELFRFGRVLQSRGDLLMALTDAAVDPAQRQKLVEDVLGPRVSRQTVALVSFIVAAGRAGSLADIVDELVAMAASERRKAAAEVVSAVPLDENQQRRLAAALSKVTGRDVELRVIVDPEVIGGLRARVGDQVIDGTVRNQLQQLREQIGGAH
jgi:F-type H+-transporting ATPase subunit delta